MLTTLTVATVSLFVWGGTRLAAKSFDPRWRRRGWCVSVFATLGAMLGGTFAGISSDRYPDGVLMASAFCAFLGAGTGNVVRILSGPERERGRNVAR